MSWNHNTHYHRFVLDSVPAQRDRALDAGCGLGGLTRKLAARSRDVIAIDLDDACIRKARAAPDVPPNIHLVAGDVMTHPLPAASFDFIAAVATLHHLPLRPALARMRSLLRPGGVLAVVGLYRAATVTDYAISAAALPISRVIRALKGEDEVGAPLRDPQETLAEIRARVCVRASRLRPAARVLLSLHHLLEKASVMAASRYCPALVSSNTTA